jgi:hypothetical protein
VYFLKAIKWNFNRAIYHQFVIFVVSFCALKKALLFYFCFCWCVI